MPFIGHLIGLNAARHLGPRCQDKGRNLGLNSVSEPVTFWYFIEVSMPNWLAHKKSGEAAGRSSIESLFSLV